MKLRYGVLFLALVLLAAFPTQAVKVNKADLEATHILLGKVDNVESFFGVNERGDQIILSRVKVKALKWIKGDRSDYVDFIVEGGSVGDLALGVSDIPEFEKGQKMRLLLKRMNGEFKYEDSEIEVSARAKPAKPTVQCCKTYAAWPTTPVQYYVNTDNVHIASEKALADIEAGASAWTTASGKAVLSCAGSTTISTVAKDNTNAVFFSNTSSGSAIAVTYYWYQKRTRVMLEFDMYFFEAAWDFHSLTAGDSCYEGFYYETIATHEFGHAIGIDHNRCTDSIMYPYASYCETNTVTADDLACLGKLYQ
jgi:predicted Zn-dependent protease